MTNHAASSTAPCVLYVDDYAINVQLMQALFELCTDFQLRHAGCAREALALHFPARPALLMLDLNLPDVHGSRLLHLLRRQNDWADIPAVAVTADHGFDALRSGFHELWPKPLDLRFVLQRLQVLTHPEGQAPVASSAERLPAPAARRPFPAWPSLRARGPR